jgi:hypothetical protein
MRAEADLAELEEQLGSAKKKTPELKNKVRAARQAAREAREG